MARICDLDEAIAGIEDGALLAIPADYAGNAMTATRALIRRGVKELRLLTVPTSTLQAELLIGAGCVAALETSAVGFGELGSAPRFTAAVKAGTLPIKDATCPAIHAALRAGEMGNPFGPIRGLIGSDVLANRPDWRVIQNPFPPHDPIVVVPAIRPDVALFHAAMADRAGNVWIGRRRDLFHIAHASMRSIVTVERIVEDNLLQDETLAPATLPSFYLDRIAVAPRGAWPLKFGSEYEEDTQHILAYIRQAATEEGFRRYLDEHVFGLVAA